MCESPDLRDVYEAAGPSGEIDTRSGAVIVTSLALLAFVLTDRAEGNQIDILGMKFSIANATYVGLAFFVSVFYSSLQLWIAWHTKELAFHQTWLTLRAEFQRFVRCQSAEHANEFTKIQKEFELSAKNNVKVLNGRRRYERKVWKTVKTVLGVSDFDAVEGVDEYFQARGLVNDAMDGWDRQHPLSDTARSSNVLGIALRRLSSDSRALDRFIERFEEVFALLEWRARLELLIPTTFAVLAAGLFIGLLLRERNYWVVALVSVPTAIAILRIATGGITRRSHAVVAAPAVPKPEHQFT